MRYTNSGVYVSLHRQFDGCAAYTAILSNVEIFSGSMAISRSFSSLVWLSHRQLCHSTGILVAPLFPVSAHRFAQVVSTGLRLLGRLFRRLDLAGLCRHSQRLWERSVHLLLRLVVLLPEFRRARLERVDPADSRLPEELRDFIGSPQRVSRTLGMVSQGLCGRLLTFSELIRHELGDSKLACPATLEAVIDALSILGRLEMLPAIERQWNSASRCSRCGSVESLRSSDVCARCGSTCIRCSECSSLGVMTACDWLFHCPPERTLSNRVAELKGVALRIPFSLTPAQERCAGRVLDYLESGASEQFVIWAACGAGKTEVVCEAIARALAQGHTVLYVVPRQTVASELHARLSRYFAPTEVALRSGKHRIGPQDARLVVCTAHQTLRMKHFADLVVFDEIDAYPCEPGGYLERSVERSVKPGGKMICLTATPDSSMFERMRDGSLQFTLLAERHHGRPMPIPQIATVSCPSRYSKTGFRRRPRVSRSQDCLVNALSAVDPTSDTGRLLCPWDEPDSISDTPLSRREICSLCVAASKLSPALVFVPTIASVERCRRALEGTLGEFWPDIKWGFCHSRLPDNVNEVSRLREGRLDCIVTTTVLERGITVPGVNAVIAGADNSVFDFRSLVQMAGRVGRTADCPTGRVLFVVERMTTEVRRAVSMIEFMNASAEK